MNRKMHRKIFVSGVVAALSFLPGCMDNSKTTTNVMPSETSNMRESSPMTGDVLVTIKGSPAITTDSLEKEKEKLFKANPQIKQAIAFMDPQELDRNILEGLISQRLIDEYIAINKINETNDYQEALKDLCAAQKQFLNLKYFSERNPVSVSDSEIKSFYEANKDKQLRVSQGGIAATGIEFADGAAARAFVARVKSSAGGFKKVAQDDGLNAKIKDFKLVNNQSVGIDEQLRDKIAAIKTVPSTEIFEINGMFWVVNATSKEDPKYLPYEQIKDRIREQLEQQKRVESFTKDVENLKKEYSVEINEEYFRPAAAQQAANMQPTMNDNAPAAEKEQRLA